MDTADFGASPADSDIVAGIVRGNPAGLAEAYQRYADRLFAYCRTIVSDPDSAADAVHDTFVIASQRVGELRDPNRLRPWLYTVARNECLRHLRAHRRLAPLEAAGDPAADTADLAEQVQAEEVRELVWSAAEGLSDNDREVLELAVRHGLEPADVGAVLGVSTNHAHARLSRAKDQIHRSLGSLLVARSGTHDCPELGALLDGWDGRHLTGLLRKRVTRHIDRCLDCLGTRDRQLSPAALLAAYAALPFVALDMWPRVRLTCADAAAAVTRAGVAARAGGFHPETGFPTPTATPRQPGRVWWAAAAAVALLLLGGGLIMAIPRGSGAPLVLEAPGHGAPRIGPDGRPQGPVASIPAPASSRAPGVSPGVAAPGTPSVPGPNAGAAGGTPQKSSPPAGLYGAEGGSPTTPASPLAALGVTTWVDAGKVGCDGTTWHTYVYANVTGGTATNVRLNWTTADGTHGSAELHAEGEQWVVYLSGLPPAAMRWTVTAQTGDGRAGRASGARANPCRITKGPTVAAK